MDLRKGRVSFVFFIPLLVFSGCLFYAGFNEATWFNRKSLLAFEYVSLEVTDLDDLLFPDEPVRGLRNIFFVETSCGLMNVSSNDTEASPPAPEGLRLSARAACSVEAAARAHPRRPVYVAHTCPVGDASTWPSAARAALALPNVRVWVVRVAEEARGSVLERLLRDGRLAQSNWPTEHASDALRQLLLSKYGGTYLDTDVLMLRSMGDMTNFAAAQSEETVSSAVMDLALDETSREVDEECTKELNQFDPKKWSYKGPDLISRVLKRRCCTGKFTNTTTKQCRGFQILPIFSFHPIPNQQWEKFFEEKGEGNVMKAIKDCLGVRVWKAMNKKKLEVSLTSMQPYAQIARQVCPNVVDAIVDKPGLCCWEFPFIFTNTGYF